MLIPHQMINIVKREMPEQLNTFRELKKLGDKMHHEGLNAHEQKKYNHMLGSFVEDVIRKDNVTVLRTLFYADTFLTKGKFQPASVGGYYVSFRIPDVFDRHFKDKPGIPLMHVALGLGALKCAQWLCKSGCENPKKIMNAPVYNLVVDSNAIFTPRHMIHYRRFSGALDCAILSREPQMVDFALSQGADVTAGAYLLRVMRFKNQGRVLESEYLSEEDKIRMIQSLLAHGANPHQTSKCYLLHNKPATAWEFAEEYGEKKVAEVLKNACADWDKKHPVRVATMRFLATFGQLLSGSKTTPAYIRLQQASQLSLPPETRQKD